MREKLEFGEKQSSPLAELADRETLKCSDVFFHASSERGGCQDPIAVSIVEETADYLGVGCVNACRNFDPEIIVLTGGMTHAGMQLLGKVRAAYAAHHWNISAVDPSRIVLASCGNSAGKIGAAAVGFLKEHAHFLGTEKSSHVE